VLNNSRYVNVYVFSFTRSLVFLAQTHHVDDLTSKLVKII